jgi:predicted dehydrogenase
LALVSSSYPEGISMQRPLLLAALACWPLLLPPAAGAQEAPPLRAGIIGLDTSHVVAFTAMLNGPRARGGLSGVRVVAAYPGGSPDVTASRDRLQGFTQTLRDRYRVEIVSSIDALLRKVDVVLLESVDGRPHLEQVRPVLQAHKPVFIDKPVAGSLADAVRLYQVAKETGTPCFSSSALRFGPGVQAVRRDPQVGRVLGCAAYSPCTLEGHHPDLFWYGVHGVEVLFTVMGPGCESAARVQTRDTELVTGTWKDGRVGTYRGLRSGKQGYGALVFGTRGIVAVRESGSYEPLVAEIVQFFRTGKPPVSPEETLEIYAFMEAAQESKRRGGSPVRLAEVLDRAREKAARK